MFDDFARSLLPDFPEFEGLTPADVARALSRAYLGIIERRAQSSGDLVSLDSTLSYLRRLANVVAFHVVLNPERGPEHRRAGAFVVAESLAILADYLRIQRRENRADDDASKNGERYTRVESALFYLIAEYDACAAGVLSLPPPTVVIGDRVDVQAAAWCFLNLETFCRLRLTPPLPMATNIPNAGADALGPAALEADTVARLYVEVGTAVAEFAMWLGGGNAGLDAAVARIDRMIEALRIVEATTTRTGHDYSKIYHLCTILRLCFPSLGERSLFHRVPSPAGGDNDAYQRYLRVRAVGDEQSSGRPVLWPSAMAYVRDCIVGQTPHAVAAMPTGSGKSMVGELAVSQAVSSGWALYLAPTNALAEQIRGDLRTGLRELGTQVFAFIGDQEYSVLGAETVENMTANSVAVMTPEKCALALRLSPNAFANCKLVVFDECQLLGEGGSFRGPNAELVMSQLMLRAPEARFLLMSAIVQNPDDLSAWLAEATGRNARSITIRWRPTRTLRAALGVENTAFQAAAEEAQAELSNMPDRRKSLSFASNCAIAACLRGAWQSEEEADYTIAGLECDADLAVSREKLLDEWHYSFNAKSWVNGTAINLATCLADSGIQTLVFTPASKHYPFSNGRKMTLKRETLAALPPKPRLVDICSILAEYELGCRSEVFELLEKGVAVHTALMLETEKIASEQSFRARSVPVMFATGTLAQGLNLPAIAVIIAGTRIGDPRGEDHEVVEQRKFSQLLNAAGRAGRAGFANQGIVITIPDHPVAFRSFEHVLAVRNAANFLQKSDDAVTIESGLDQFLDNVCRNALRADAANDLELQVVAALAGGDGNQLEPQSVLRRTYAAFRRRRNGQADVTEADARFLGDIRSTFIRESGAPDWLTIAAQRAGLDFFLTHGISAAWRRLRPEIPDEARGWTVMQWLDEFLRAAAFIPPGLIERQFPRNRLERATPLFKPLFTQHPQLLFERNLAWQPNAGWFQAWASLLPSLQLWMNGASIVEIAAHYTGLPPGQIPPTRTQGKPLPQALSVTGECWSSLALIAGGFLAIAEQLMQGQVPLPLACLPMCIKYGCDSPSSLAWYRFGVRLRRPSRMLATTFPVPELQTDEEMRQWVRNQRRMWLNGEAEIEDPAIAQLTRELTALFEFITN